MGVDERIIRDDKEAKAKANRLKSVSQRRAKQKQALDATCDEQTGLIRDLLAAGLTTRYIGNLAGLSHTVVGKLRKGPSSK